MSRDCCVALPRDAMGLSAVCYCVFLDHAHLLILCTHVGFEKLSLQPWFKIIISTGY